jgi:CO/xanthine dehydrogenase FAD-binding subunit
MPQQPTAYHRPETLAEALRLLAQPDSFALAGGVHLLAADVPGAVVDLQALGLNQAQISNGRLHVGATLTLDNLAVWLQENAADAPATALLRQAIGQAGPNTYRHAATIGGIVAARLPDSELLAALLTLDARLHLHAPEPTTLTLADYLAAAERPSGLITQVEIVWQNGRFASERVARTPADYPIVAITGWQPNDGPVRLAASGIAGRPMRLTAAEMALAQGKDEATAVSAAQSACTHPGDFRGDAAYRRDMTAVLLRRVLAAMTVS